MFLDYRKFTKVLAAALLLACVTMPGAHAEDDDDDEEEFNLPMVSNAKWKAECGSCHVAFPPHMLPANSWRALMSGLDKHFGSDASLDAATGNEIAAFLEKNASHRWSESAVKPQLRIAAQLRITETRWFRSEHREVGARVWSNPKVKSPANCAACHTQAENGHFGEHEVRIPQS
jgi:hypothetical protein